jgi:Leucine-rich repeat (LRR) protein
VSIPESIVKLKNLESLDLSDNKITSLPKSMKKLKKLKKLNLKGNTISAEEKERLKKELPNCEISF